MELYIRYLGLKSAQSYSCPQLFSLICAVRKALSSRLLSSYKLKFIQEIRHFNNSFFLLSRRPPPKKTRCKCIKLLNRFCRGPSINYVVSNRRFFSPLHEDPFLIRTLKHLDLGKYFQNQKLRKGLEMYCLLEEKLR